MIINGKTLLLYAPIKNMATQKQRSHGVSWGLAEAGYDIRLAETILFTHRDGYDSVTRDGTITKGRFILASSIEEFDIPNDLVGVVHDKSTHARQGLSVFNTVLEPGWKGILTLELVHHGQDDLLLPAGCGIAQVLFSEITEPQAYFGKYQNQEAGPQASRYK